MDDNKPFIMCYVKHTKYKISRIIRRGYQTGGGLTLNLKYSLVHLAARILMAG